MFEQLLYTGIFTDPRDFLREYVLNSCQACVAESLPLKIEIITNLHEGKVTICDKGPGVLLSELIRWFFTPKDNNGVGRFSVVPFAEKIILKSSVKGREDEVTVEFDIGDHFDLIMKDGGVNILGTTATEKNNETINQSFFEIEVFLKPEFLGFFSSESISSYLCRYAPIPYSSEFMFSSILENNQPSSEINNLLELYVDRTLILKPYENTVPVKGGRDSISKVENYEIKDDDDNLLAIGWYSVRENHIGQILDPERLVPKIRLKKDNIQVGDDSYLDKSFNEARFNNYYIGECHICSPDIKVNRQNTGLLPNKASQVFFEKFMFTIGLPLSKEVRTRSSQKNHVEGK